MLKGLIVKHGLVSKGIHRADPPANDDGSDDAGDGGRDGSRMMDRDELQEEVRKYEAGVNARNFLLGLRTEARETKLRSQNSCNSLNFDPTAVEGAINKAIREQSIAMPPTREGLKKLFVAMNLDVPPLRCIDCLVYIRGKRMESSNPEEFDFQKLIKWFLMNIRIFKHIDTGDADPEWLEDSKLRSELARNSMPGASWKPHPQAYIRRGTGTGGRHISRIIKSRGMKISKNPFGDDMEVIHETNPSAFQEYGIGAPTMATTYDYVSNLKQSRGGASMGVGGVEISWTLNHKGSARSGRQFA